MKKINTITTDKKIGELAKLQATIGQVSAQRFKAISYINAVTEEVRTLERSIEKFKRDNRKPWRVFGEMGKYPNGKFDETRLDAKEKGEYETLLSRLATLNVELPQAQEKLNLLQEHETALLAEMAKLNGNYATECLLHLQQKQLAAEQLVSRIREAIAIQEGIINQSEIVDTQSISEIDQQRDEMLADIALGIVSPEEFPAINEKLRVATASAEESSVLMNSVITEASQTISGLKRKLVLAESDLATVSFSRVEAEQRYLLAEAENVGLKYIEAAKAVTANLRLLLALHEIMTRKRYSGIGGNAVADLIRVPTFELNCHKQVEENGNIAELENASRYRFLEEDIKGEVDRISAAGIML